MVSISSLLIIASISLLAKFMADCYSCSIVTSPVAVYGAIGDDDQDREDSFRNGRQTSSNGVTTTVVDVVPASTRAASSQLAAPAEQSSTAPLSPSASVPGDPFEHQLSPSSWSIISYPDVMIATTCYGLTCMIWVGIVNLLSLRQMGLISCNWLHTQVFFDETFALFCQTPLNEGGLSMNESQIGICLAVCGSIMILFQVFVNSSLTRRYGVVRIYHWCLYITGKFM
jgi:hypothetical protein